MQVGEFLVQDPDDVQIPFVGQLVVQAADDVQFGATPVGRLASPGDDLLVRHDVALFGLQVGPERAKRAAIDAHVGRVEVFVDVVVGGFAVLSLPDNVGEFAEGVQVGVRVEEDAVVKTQSLGVVHLGSDQVNSLGRGHVPFPKSWRSSGVLHHS